MFNLGRGRKLRDVLRKTPQGVFEYRPKESNSWIKISEKLFNSIKNDLVRKNEE